MVHDFVIRMTGHEPLSGVNVDEAVALGAAIRANQTANGKQQMSLTGASPAGAQKMIGGKKITDVTTHALGMLSVSADGERYITDILIDKNSPLPCEKTIRRQLRVSRKQENELEVYVLQGSDPSPLNCDITGKYVFTGIRYVENGQAIIDITYKYNENGIIEVGATQADNNHVLKVSKTFEIGDMSWAGRSPKDNVGAIPTEGEIFLIADLSGSMEGAPLAEAKRAMTKFVDDADLDCFKIGIIGVADSVKVYLKPSNDAVKINASIRAIAIGDCGYCNEAHPFDILLSEFSKDCELKYAVVLADGVWEKQKNAVQAAAQCHRNGIAIIGLGFGGADKDFMESISSEKDLAVITQMGGLTSSFSKIAQIIGSRGNSLTRG
jgi:molecular chaperone DnaK